MLYVLYSLFMSLPWPILGYNAVFIVCSDSSTITGCILYFSNSEVPFVAGIQFFSVTGSTV